MFGRCIFLCTHPLPSASQLPRDVEAITLAEISTRPVRGIFLVRGALLCAEALCLLQSIQSPNSQVPAGSTLYSYSCRS